MKHKAIVGAALDDDTTVAYLFECSDCERLAVSFDANGSNLPQDQFAVWERVCEFKLGVHEAVP